jgi:hypothetical protein
MDSILNGELADTISDALLDAGIPLDVVVTRLTPNVGGDPADPPPPTLTDHACKGFADRFSDAFIAAGLIERGDIKVVVVANTLAIEPEPGDQVTIRGKTYRVFDVSADPALALYELQARA